MRKKSLECASYAIIFVIAAALRFYLLGNATLSESEALAALKAFHLAQGQDVILGSQAGYTLITSILFFIFHASEFWARFLPALVGSAMVLSPLLYKKYIGDLAAVLLAVGLAIDPGLIIASRTADGAVLGFTFFLFTGGFLLRRQPALCGISAALGLLGGLTFWFGAAILLMSETVVFVYCRIMKKETFSSGIFKLFREWNGNWKKFLVSLGLTLFVVFSIFLFVPDGLGGLFSGMAAFVEGWFQPPNISNGLIFADLIFYEALPVLLGIAAAIIAIQRRNTAFLYLIVWILAARLLIFVYPARDISLISWMTIPFWILSAKYILVEYSLEDVEKGPFLGLVGVILVVLVFAWMNLKGIFTGATPDSITMQLRVASVLGSMLIIILATGLVVWGWSVNTAAKGLLSAIVLALMAANIATIWNTSPVMQNRQSQEITLSNHFVDEDLFLKTLADYERWNIGPGNPPKILLAGINSQTVEWAVRNHKNIERVQVLPIAMDPQIVITNAAQQLLLENQYAGQDFVLSRKPGWDELDLGGWLRWLFLRESPHVDENVILWVRADQFPGYEANEFTPAN